MIAAFLALPLIFSSFFVACFCVLLGEYLQTLD